MSVGGNPEQWRGVSGVPGLGLSVPFSLDTSGSVLNLWEEEKRPRNLWRSIKLWKGWGKEGGRSCQRAEDGKPRNEQSGGGGQVELSSGGQVVLGEQVGGQVGGVQHGLASHSCRKGRLLAGKLKGPNTQVGVSTGAGGGHRPVRPLLSLPAYWQNQIGGGIRSCSVATQTSPQVASHKRLQRSSASSTGLPIPSTASNGLQTLSGKNSSSRMVEPQTSSDIESIQRSTNLGLPMSEVGQSSLKETHSLLKRETSGKPTNAAALQRLSSSQTQAVPPPLPPRLSLSHLPPGQPRMPPGQPNLPPGQPRLPPGHQRIGESHPRLARLSSSHLPRILSQSSVHDGRDGRDGRGGEESSDLGGSLSSTGSVQGEVPFRSRHDSLYSMGFSDICSPLTEVEPDYSTENSDEDDDEEDDEKMRVGAIGHHEDGNIYEQVLNCRKPSLRLQLPPLPLSSLPAPPTRHPPPKTHITPFKTNQEVGGVKMWAQGGEVIEEERKPGLRWKARQLKESLSAKFSVKLHQLRN